MKTPINKAMEISVRTIENICHSLKFYFGTYTIGTNLWDAALKFHACVQYVLVKSLPHFWNLQTLSKYIMKCCQLQLAPTQQSSSTQHTQPLSLSLLPCGRFPQVSVRTCCFVFVCLAYFIWRLSSVRVGTVAGWSPVVYKYYRFFFFFNSLACWETSAAPKSWPWQMVLQYPRALSDTGILLPADKHHLRGTWVTE